MTKTIATLMLLLALVVVGCGAPAAQAPTVAPAATSVPATEAPTATEIPPTATAVPPAATSVPPTATLVPPTATSVPPTETPTVEPTTAPTEAGAPPIDATPAGGGSVIPHPIVGMEGQCLTCHGEGGQKPVPADHAGRTVDTCTTCHLAGDDQPDGGNAGPKIPHPIAGMEGQCLTCHGSGGQKPVPADHASRTVDTCQTCHKPKS